MMWMLDYLSNTYVALIRTYSYSIGQFKSVLEQNEFAFVWHLTYIYIYFFFYECDLM